MGAIHAGRPDRLSKRQEILLKFLRAAGGRGLSAREFYSRTDECAINTIASELRAKGYVIDCPQEGSTENGRRVYRYYLRSEPAAAAPPAKDPEPQAPPAPKFGEWFGKKVEKPRENTLFDMT